jgi:hypothetical protein
LNGPAFLASLGALVTIAACGGVEQTPPTPPAEDSRTRLDELCPALESMVPEDCTLDVAEVTFTSTGAPRPPVLVARTPEDVAHICQSPCKHLNGWLTLDGSEWSGLERALVGVETIDLLVLSGYQEPNEPLTDLRRVETLGLLGYPGERVEGFENLEEAGLTLRGGQIRSLEGLDSLETLNYIDAEGTPLRDLSGLEEVDVITDCISLRDMPELESIQGLGAVESLSRDVNRPVCAGSSLVIDRAPKIQDLRGLESLRTAKFRIQLDILPSLRSLEGLEALESVGGLFISQNENLSDVSLPALESVGPDVTGSPFVLRLNYNPKVPFCQIQQIADQAGLGADEVYATENGDGSCD